MIGLSNTEYVVPENIKPPSQTADGLSGDMSRKTILECLLYFRMVLVIWLADLLLLWLNPRFNFFFIIKIHRILNPQKNPASLSVGFLGFQKMTLQKPTPPIAAAVFSGWPQELPSDDLEEVNESNGSELFLTRVPEDAG